MIIHRVHRSNTYLENVQIWKGDAITGEYVGLISGKNMAGTTQNYEFCVDPAVHTLLLDHAYNQGWGQGSYFKIRVGGVTLMKGTLSRLSYTSFKVYRMCCCVKSLCSVHGSPNYRCMEVLGYYDKRLE